MRQLSPNETTILLALHKDQNRSAWWSKDELARLAGLTRRPTLLLEALVHLGLLEDDSRHPDGDYSQTRYRLTAQGEAKAEATAPTPVRATRAARPAPLPQEQPPTQSERSGAMPPTRDQSALMPNERTPPQCACGCGRVLPPREHRGPAYLQVLKGGRPRKYIQGHSDYEQRKARKAAAGDTGGSSR